MRLSLATRIFLGYAVVLVTFGGVSLFSVTEMHRNQVEFRLVSDGYLHLSQDIAAIDTFHSSHDRDTQRIREEQNEQTRRALIRLSRLYFPGLMNDKVEAARKTAIRILDFAPDDEQPSVAEIAQRLTELGQRYANYNQQAEQVLTLLDQPSPNWEVANGRLDDLQQDYSAIGSSIHRAQGLLESRINHRVVKAQERERRTGVAVIGLPVLAIAIGLVATAFAARTLRPVKTLIDNVSKIGRGDYTVQLNLRGDDEIAQLARAFDAMARSLQEREAALRQKQEELLRSERLAAVGKISAQIAHEVRNPLSSIGLNVEMLEEQLQTAGFKTDSERKEAEQLVKSVTRELDRLTELTEEYLRMARQPVPQAQREDVHALLDQVVAFSKEELERARVKVVRNEPDDPLWALADGAQLRQVLLNLIRNAREAMASGGTLTLATSAYDGEVQISVTDDGPGIAPDVQKRMFEPFFSTKPSGTGLGLSVSRQIIQAHRGSLSLESAPGKGTTFVMRLPKG